ncbi:DNA alkylation repair protein [Magnetococcus sp. PR-3]|uniref:DNA alkylation repair protein n=1 Tax=Magnetococcus sp. PR-3 TaxID=3120355 RepID=UPI002FCE1865
MEPFKERFNQELIRAMAVHFKRVEPTFDVERFCHVAITGLDQLELKARSQQITDALAQTLPTSFPHAATTLAASLHPVDDAALADMGMDDQGLAGWAIMPMADYVAEYGQGDVNVALDLLGAMTKRFSAEFAIRPFLLTHTDQSLRQLTLWSRDDNEHLRRLASEGSRPRLPWGMQLPIFIADPAPLFTLLDPLKDDPSAYVRRSVANNLNDISKDHPDSVVAFLANWMVGLHPQRLKLIQHALRTLIKQGHQGALHLLGYSEPDLHQVKFELHTPQITLGDKLCFRVELLARGAQNLIVDYRIHHVKANGQRTPKVFKWKKLSLTAGKSHCAQRCHAIKPVTTRVYYSGTHLVELLVNGQVMAEAAFELKVPHA